MTTVILSVQMMLVAFNGALVGGTLDPVFGEDVAVKVVLTVLCGVLLAGIGPFLPKVSATFRRNMGLQRRANG